ncbi:MAG TPA: hypothetical protein VIH97_13445 [Candidatus Acidoferrales bacterium]
MAEEVPRGALENGKVKMEKERRVAAEDGKVKMENRERRREEKWKWEFARNKHSESGDPPECDD